MMTNRLFSHQIIKSRTIKIIQSRNIYNICDVQTPQYQLISSKALIKHFQTSDYKIKYYRRFELSKDRKILRQRIFQFFFIQNNFNLKKKHIPESMMGKI